MSKDPAFLYYDGDAAKDVSHMNRLERGCYFDFLQAQRKFGRMQESLIRKILGKDFETCWESLKICLTCVEDMYFIEWLENSTNKRKEYSESRKRNRTRQKEENKQDMSNISLLYDKDMENENENRNEIEDSNEIENVKEQWNSFAKEFNLPEIIKLSDKRKSSIKQRMQEKEFVLREIFERIRGSDFLLGNKTDWKIDFDFIFCSRNNYLKVLEGKYQNNGNSKQRSDNSKHGATPEEIVRAIDKAFNLITEPGAN